MKTSRLFITSLIAFALFLTFSLKTHAQGNLQFNQVINQNMATAYTVPVGKVFKLEGAMSVVVSGNDELRFGTAAGLSDLGKIIAGPYIYFGTATVNYTSNWPFPLWFKAGTVISSASSTQMQINGIEFNIVP